MQSYSSFSTPNPGSTARGVVLVALGAMSYGLLSTFVKLAYRQGYTTTEVTLTQFVWGAAVLSLAPYILRLPRATRGEKLSLLLTGTTTGFTSVFYYISVNSIAASVAVVLLMQSIWMGVVYECVTKRARPPLKRLVAVGFVLIGTTLATHFFESGLRDLNPRGILFGFLAAVSFTSTLIATGGVATHLSPITRSQFMVYGGFLVVLAFAVIAQIAPYYCDVRALGEAFTTNRALDLSVLGQYGAVLALFGTILPPLLLNKGFPLTGVGLGSIVSSIELPVAVLFASATLGEPLTPGQLVGVLLILASVIVLNLNVIGARASADK